MSAKCKLQSQIRNNHDNNWIQGDIIGVWLTNQWDITNHNGIYHDIWDYIRDMMIIRSMDKNADYSNYSQNGVLTIKDGGFI